MQAKRQQNQKECGIIFRQIGEPKKIKRKRHAEFGKLKSRSHYKCKSSVNSRLSVALPLTLSFEYISQRDFHLENSQSECENVVGQIEKPRKMRKSAKQTENLNEKSANQLESQMSTCKTALSVSHSSVSLSLSLPLQISPGNDEIPGFIKVLARFIVNQGAISKTSARFFFSYFPQQFSYIFLPCRPLITQPYRFSYSNMHSSLW